MAQILDPNIPKIVYSRTSKKTMEGELFIKQHVFDYIISGTSDVFFDGKLHPFKAGDFRFAARNRLSKFVKIPPAGGEYRSISICIDQDTLHEIKDSNITNKKFDNVFLLKPNKAFNNYIDSLIPYLENGGGISEQLLRVKIKEAVLIFLEANPGLKDVLFDFSEPGKIDLEAYMNEHYSFNGELEQFAYLTGRSLSTFKRDFKEIFKTTPNKWLMKKRLDDAYYLIKERGLRPNDAYIEVGFKDYSHFSFAFKKVFGFSPSLAR
ncbi:helix-turn-helix domain-containing protein [Chitinophaga sp. SYP-B3965]|uniref:helix-turn-helix domain-containing protein n=1 Tax=Chitinophaga sp. SYP-B3965 TaxID=2663120 RepID=UPI0012996D91|nr:AraC family transcriptional regulator [Chitinophaga sp. SYP-B3965]MRG45076.1 helix-turn-helix domain-containing protein [Chitinophaga sp. SYP-B3965]